MVVKYGTHDRYHERDMKHRGCLKESRSFPFKGSRQSFIEMGVSFIERWAEFGQTGGWGKAVQVQESVIPGSAFPLLE